MSCLSLHKQTKRQLLGWSLSEVLLVLTENALNTHASSPAILWELPLTSHSQAKQLLLTASQSKSL